MDFGSFNALCKYKPSSPNIYNRINSLVFYTSFPSKWGVLELMIFFHDTAAMYATYRTKLSEWLRWFNDEGQRRERMEIGRMTVALLADKSRFPFSLIRCQRRQPLICCSILVWLFLRRVICSVQTAFFHSPPMLPYAIGMGLAAMAATATTTT